MPPNVATDAIPAELRELPQWVLWRTEIRNAKPTKVPYRPAEPKRRADSTAPATWGSYVQAVAASDGADGIGFVFSKDDPYSGVDFDGCVEGEDINPHVAKLMRDLDSYAEFSPSGTGLHIIVRASVNGGPCRTSKTPWEDDFENYDNGRFFCVTGQHVRGTPRTINDRQRHLDAVRAKMFPATAERKPPPAVTVAIGDDRELLDLARNAKNGHRFSALYDAAEHSYASDSEADLALCDMLAFWCGPDASRIDRLFRASARQRAKWDSRRGESTYGADTIEKALAGTEFFGEHRSPEAQQHEPYEEPRSRSDSESHSDPAEKPAIYFTRASELLAGKPPDPDWVWEGTLVRGAITLFAGKPKAGKSTLLYALAEAAAAQRDEFLGRTLQGGPVLFVSEEGIGTLGTTFPRHAEIHLLTRETCWPKPTWPDLVSAAAAAAADLNAALVVIDTFAYWGALAADAEKDAGSVQPLLDALGEIAQTGCAVVLDHHHRKAGGEDGDAIRGSGAIVGGVDAFAELEKIEGAPSNHRRLVVTPRWSAPPVLIVEYDEVFGHRVIGQASDREHSGEIGWTDQLLEAIPTTGDGVTLEEIAELLDADRRKWHKTFTALMDAGTVTRTGKGNRYDPFRHLCAAVPRSRPDEKDGKDGSTQSAQPSSRIYTDGCSAAANSVQASRGTDGRLTDTEQAQPIREGTLAEQYAHLAEHGND